MAIVDRGFYVFLVRPSTHRGVRVIWLPLVAFSLGRAAARQRRDAATKRPGAGSRLTSPLCPSADREPQVFIPATVRAGIRPRGREEGWACTESSA